MGGARAGRQTAKPPSPESRDGESLAHGVRESWRQVVEALEDAGVHHLDERFVTRREMWDILKALYEVASDQS